MSSQFAARYKTYWTAWLALLVVTVLMVFVANRSVLIAGMVFKAAIILMLFMHLKYEKFALIVTVLLGVFATSLLLYGLLIPDGMAMSPCAGFGPPSSSPSWSRSRRRCRRRAADRVSGTIPRPLAWRGASPRARVCPP